MKLRIPIGSVLFALGLYLAFFQHSPYWYTVFLIGGFLLLDGINKPKGFSVVYRNLSFLRTWIIFAVIGLAVEVTGNYLLNLWDYPTFSRLDYVLHVVIIGYPFTGFFALEFFVLLLHAITSKYMRILLLPVFSILFGYLNEIPNVFAHEWIYHGWPGGEFLGIPVLVSLLWTVTLASLLFKESSQVDGV